MGVFAIRAEDSEESILECPLFHPCVRMRKRKTTRDQYSDVNSTLLPGKKKHTRIRDDNTRSRNCYLAPQVPFVALGFAYKGLHCFVRVTPSAAGGDVPLSQQARAPPTPCAAPADLGSSRQGARKGLGRGWEAVGKRLARDWKGAWKGLGGLGLRRFPRKER